MARIARAMPVTPVPLVSHALVNGAHSRAELEQSVAARIAAARDRGATIHIPRDDLTYTVEAGLRALMERRLLNIGPEGGLELSEAGTRMAEFYAASVAHLLDGEVDAPHTGAEDPPQRQVAAT
jgi:glycerol-3-phosphate O-acyltransferase